jgi:hypothetical protein
MARSRFRRISSLTEKEALRASKSGMRRSSPSVRGFEWLAEECIEELAVIKAPFREPTASARTTLIQSVPIAAGALAHYSCFL